MLVIPLSSCKGVMVSTSVFRMMLSFSNSWINSIGRKIFNGSGLYGISTIEMLFPILPGKRLLLVERHSKTSSLLQGVTICSPNRGDTISFWDDLIDGAIQTEIYPTLFGFAKDPKTSL
jgi:hypothetical protein